MSRRKSGPKSGNFTSFKWSDGSSGEERRTLQIYCLINERLILFSREVSYEESFEIPLILGSLGFDTSCAWCDASLHVSGTTIDLDNPPVSD